MPKISLDMPAEIIADLENFTLEMQKNMLV